MAFVKLDCGILDSTLWIDRDSREIFITALLMAVPHEVVTPLRHYEVRTLTETGWEVPPGWYGFVPAAGIGIVRRAGLDAEAGLSALERLGSAEAESRSSDFGGRRLVRVDGGYIVLNFMKYRDRDYTGAERAKRYRERKRGGVNVAASRVTLAASRRDITQAEAEAEAEELNKTPLPPKRRTRKPEKSPFPEDFTLTADLASYATERLPGVEASALFESFRSKSLAKGWRYVDWRHAFQEFVRNSAPKSGHFAAGQYPKAIAGQVWE